MEASKHPDEPERLSDLRSFNILDTPPEQDYDDIVAVAAQLCGTEASTITFVDTDRQWFKAAVGMPAVPAPLENAICAHTIVGDGFLEIEDTLKDDRTKDNPGCNVVDGFRFYAGAQLLSSNGLPIGTLCVLGRTPKKLSVVQRNVLQVMANHVAKLLELRKSLKSSHILLKEVDHRVKNSLQLVASLTTLQRRNAPSQEVKDALSQVQERVMALATLHNVIQNSNSSQTVNLRVLLDDLSRLLKRSITSNVDIVVDVVDISVTARLASSISVIVNEFASNSIKHGFPDGENGKIRFTATTPGPDRFELCCSDDGVGSEPIANGATGIGLRAMRACAEQVSGSLTIDSSAVGFQVTFSCDLSAG
jgi:two-component sensor histidine kinase